jgi:60 kDa SS-A/Ro ribonucleoprotein
MQRYTTHLTTQTPQRLPIKEVPMVRNRAGGYVFEVTDAVRLQRFLILGTDQGSYYATPRELTREAALVIDRLLEDGQGRYVVDQIVEISTGARAPKNEPAILALALALKAGDVDTRRYAATAVPKVCRTFTHLISLETALQSVGKHGLSRVTKRAIHNWFDSKGNDDLVYQGIKYRNRQGWSLRDLLRMSRYHAKGWDVHRNEILGWLVGKEGVNVRHPQLQAFLAVQSMNKGEYTGKDVASIVRESRLPWEAVPSEWSRDLTVQAALFESMPIGTLVRQLGRLTAIGLLAPGSEHVQRTIDRLGKPEQIKRARMHPMALYLASKVYGSGGGIRSKLTWKPIPGIVDALGSAFLGSFGNIEPSNKNIVIGVDCSGSMYNNQTGRQGKGTVLDIPDLWPAEVALMEAYVIARTEPNARLVAFDTRPLPFDFDGVEGLAAIKAKSTELRKRLGGGTDVSMPILHATQGAYMDVDAFVCLTDDESWAGSIHPIEALGRYREKSGRPTKLVSVAFVGHGYSVVPQDDAGSMSVVGFDEQAPAIIADFLAQPSPVIPQLAGSR